MRTGDRTRRFIVILMTVLLMMDLMAAAAVAQSLTAPVMKTESPINLDGFIKKDEWENAGAGVIDFLQDMSQPLLDYGGKEGTRRNVILYALRDGSHLYLAVDVEDITLVDESAIRTQNDGIILLFAPKPGGRGVLSTSDIGWSFFIVPDANSTDPNVTSNKHFSRGGVWSTAPQIQQGEIVAQFSIANGGRPRGWQMEILIPFTELNKIDPRTENEIGFALFIINDWGDSQFNGSIGLDDLDGYLAFPAALAQSLDPAPTALITPCDLPDCETPSLCSDRSKCPCIFDECNCKPLFCLLEAPEFKNPALWGKIQFGADHIKMSPPENFRITN